MPLCGCREGVNGAVSPPLPGCASGQVPSPSVEQGVVKKAAVTVSRHSAKTHFSRLTAVSSPARSFGRMLASSWTGAGTEAQRGGDTFCRSHSMLGWVGFLQATPRGRGPVLIVGDPQGQPFLLQTGPRPGPEARPPAEFLLPCGADTNSPPQASQKQPPSAPVAWQPQNPNRLLIKDQKGEGRGGGGRGGAPPNQAPLQAPHC